jgi:hypothetical protein
MTMTYTHHPYGEQRVIAIEYQWIDKGWRPFDVFTIKNGSTSLYCHQWDFDWCRRDGVLIYRCTGSGGGVYFGPLCEPNHKSETAPRLWWDRAFPNPRGCQIKSKPVTERTINRWGYRIIGAPLLLKSSWGDTTNPFEVGEYGDTTWCARCMDHVNTENLCSHIWFCDECGNYSSPSDRCGHRASTE